MTANKISSRNQLEKEGWIKKFTIEEHRIKEYKELYESLNLEVRIEPVVSSEIDGCSTCFEVECDKYKVIYTRSKGK